MKMSRAAGSEIKNFWKVVEALTTCDIKKATIDDEMLRAFRRTGILNGQQLAYSESQTTNDNYRLALADSIKQSLRKISKVQTPYEIDKQFNFELKSTDKNKKECLSDIFPVNSRCVTYKIEQDETICYIVANSNGNYVNIYKNKSDLSESIISPINKSGEQLLNREVGEMIFRSPDLEDIIGDRPYTEYNEVFKMRTGYESLKDFVKTKMPDLVSKLSTPELLDSLHKDGPQKIIEKGTNFRESLENSLTVIKILENLEDGKDYAENEKSAYLEQIEYEDKNIFSFSIEDLKTIDTYSLCNLDTVGFDKLTTPDRKLAVFKFDDGTTFISKGGSLTKYNSYEPIVEIEDVDNTPELFEMIDMIYSGECNIEYNQEPDEEPEVEVKKKRGLRP